MDENHNATLELDYVHQMDERPYEPRRQPRQVQAEHIRDGSPPANHCQTPLVEILEGWKLLFMLYFPSNLLCGVGSLLHGRLSHTRRRFSVGVYR